MKIKIENDVFDIVNRIKEIDEGYFIVFDTKRNCYEIHNSNQMDTYCMTVCNDCLDSRVIDDLKISNIDNYDRIIVEIDNNNNTIEQNVYKNIRSQSDYMVREIYDFCNNSSKKLNEDIFQTSWR